MTNINDLVFTAILGFYNDSESRVALESIISDNYEQPDSYIVRVFRDGSGGFKPEEVEDHKCDSLSDAIAASHKFEMIYRFKSNLVQDDLKSTLRNRHKNFYRYKKNGELTKAGVDAQSDFISGACAAVDWMTGNNESCITPQMYFSAMRGDEWSKE